MAYKIMLIDDDSITLKRLRQLLERQEYMVSSYSNPVRALEQMAKTSYDLVVTDVKMPGMDGMNLMITIKSRFPGTEVILMTGYASIDHAVEATREGATGYLEKPFTPEAFLDAVKNGLEHAGGQTKIQSGLKRKKADIPVIIGNSPQIREMENRVQQIAPTDCNVLITGASGSGKEVVAKLIHAISPRSTGPFVAINCGAFTETLMDNELFGHEKGAFTGASSTHPGLLESAHKGTIFLDEIGEMPHSMQVKLLRALQEKELIRVGGTKAIPFDVRVISATAKDLKAEVEAGAFRKDMFYRINVVNIELPGLKDRPGDIPLLAYHILSRLNQRQGRLIRRISTRAMSLLESYAFPGNVRELENILERAAAISTGNDIRACDLPPDLTDLELHAYQRPRDHMMTLAELEKDYIQHLLKNTRYTRARIAQILGIDRASLWRKIKKLGLG